ncbi:ABC transporter [Shewanella algae]|uniref:ABC-F family ATP-binding cassette domain-containing protein n=1 Tax=Shewanella algae TaxID=38313 RepID=UPI001BF0E63B|nr:ABC-F family ATP-binding cassette domain-containing protein [Shewanella algae]BCV56810.1 ABC transporter [Shewanella algae]
MTTLISAQSISYDIGASRLFDGLSFVISQGDRIGLIGSNGCGKSTLLHLLNKSLHDFVGQISFASSVKIALIEQQLPERFLAMSMLDAVVDNLPSEQQVELWRAQITLSDMGFDDSYWEKPIGTLSGGQFVRVLLARALVIEPDILLLDEPSNHLDLPTLIWLERFLNKWNGTFVIVSHDQRVLDHVTHCTWILRNKHLYIINQKCTKARKVLADKDRADEERHRSEQREISRIERSAQRLAIWGGDFGTESLSRKAKSMGKRAESLRTVMTHLNVVEPWKLRLLGQSLQADRLLELSSIPVSTAKENMTLFEVSFQQVKSGDRVAILGRNGVGKSSLLKVLWDNYQSANLTDVRYFHPRAKVGYYDQNLDQLCDDDSLNDALYPFCPESHEVRKMALISAGFPYSRHKQRVVELSGGERSRLLFVGLSLANHHFLLLDEPTNHLDIEGKEELADSLRNFEGGLLLVSHDRELLERSCNRFWYIDEGQLVEMTCLDTVYERMSIDTDTPSVVSNYLGFSAVTDMELIHEYEDEELLLDRLFELQKLLTQDMSRKIKHQKPSLQVKWQKEIDKIKSELELD